MARPPPPAPAPLPPLVLAQIDAFTTRLKRREFMGAHIAAVQTTVLLRSALDSAPWTTTLDALNVVRTVGRAIVRAAPLELSVGNIVRRVLQLLREALPPVVAPGTPQQVAAPQARPSLARASSMYDALAVDGVERSGTPRESTPEFARVSADIRRLVLAEIDELIDELESVHSVVAGYALEHIHSSEIVLTIGNSRTVERFLRAASTRTFQVIVAERAPWYDGQQLAARLAHASVDTTVIADSAIFAMMARVNKVIIGTHAVLANGGLLAPSGSYMVAMAAKHHATPVVVLTGLYKLSPMYAYNQDTFNSLASPETTLDFTDGTLVDQVDVATPYFDYIPPELVDLFVTNEGGQPPSYIYRLLRESYHPDDNIL